MYAFLVIVTILFPNNEIRKLYVWSEDQCAVEVCQERASEAAEAAAKRIGSVIQLGRIKTETTCTLRDVRSI